ncbi:MAG: FeoA family protein [Candidatus Baldrarchaeia archaeon]
MNGEIRLSEAIIGEMYKIVRIEGPRTVRRRIIDMGLVPGTEIKVIGKAPLGDPLNVVARGYNLTIRKSEASLIVVKAVTGK